MSKISASRISARLFKSVSIIAISAGLAACSSDSARFTDNFYTNAVPSQNVGTAQTPFPANTQRQVYQQPTYQAQQPVYAPTAPTYNSGVDRTYTASVPAQAAVQRQQLASPSVQAQPIRQVAAPVVQSTPVALAPKQVASVQSPAPLGKGSWTAVGGSYVTLKNGETISSLSKRYGVPQEEIMAANGIANADQVHAGSKVIIPVYSRGSRPAAVAPLVETQTNVASIETPVPNRRPAGTQVASLSPAMAAPVAAKTTSDSITSGKYVVTSGDTLSGVSRRTGVSIDGIKRLNGLSSDNLRIGQTLLIPGAGGNPVSPTTVAASPSVDNVKTSAKTPSQEKVAEYTPPKSKDSGSIATIDSSSTASAPAETGVETMRWPVKGRVVSSFGSNVGGKGNSGIDISVPRGTSVKSAENGVVIYAGDGLKEFGKTVLVRHGNGLVTVYGHLDTISVDRGANVTRGQSVGVSGMTGSAKQPQLHFEVRKNTSPVNPMTYLR